ncbi:MAG: hypothetical protein SGI77_17240 [Pirellulaceae bacterium]|nr:hypothetical protein [Pirellulaceae bacterium]
MNRYVSIKKCNLNYERFQRDCPKHVSDDQQQIRALSEHLPQLWRASTTTSQDRQSIERLLLEQVVVNIEGNSERVDIELRWAGRQSTYAATPCTEL